MRSAVARRSVFQARRLTRVARDRARFGFRSCSPTERRPDRKDAGPGIGNQDFCAHFSKMASHCCVAHLTESSALIVPVAALAIMSVMMKLL